MNVCLLLVCHPTYSVVQIYVMLEFRRVTNHAKPSVEGEIRFVKWLALLDF